MKFYVMTEKEYERWIKTYESIMSNPNSSAELLDRTERFNETIVIEG